MQVSELLIWTKGKKSVPKGTPGENVSAPVVSVSLVEKEARRLKFNR